MKINPFRLIFYLFISVSALLTGIYGIYLLSIKADLPFTYGENETNIVVNSSFQNIKSGDTLVSVNGVSVNKTHQIEFLIDRLETGAKADVSILSNGKQYNETVVLSPAYPDNVFIFVSALTGLAFWIIAVFLLIKKPQEREAKTLSYLLLLFAVAIATSPGKFSPEPSFLEYFVRSIHFLGYTLGIGFYFHFALIFPADRSGKNKIILKLLYVFFLIFSSTLIFYQINAMKTGDLFVQNLLHVLWGYLLLILLLCVLTGIIIFFISFFRAAYEQDRKKVQWVIWGACAGVLPYIIFWVVPTLLNINVILREEYALVFLIIIPVSFSIGIIKHQLFDIDVIFNRSLVYTVMSIILILIYAVVTFSFSSIAKNIIGDTHIVTSVISTVFFALIFAPLKIKVQITVDRIFYRQKYDFGIAVKQFVDKLKNYDSIEPLSDLVINELNLIIPVSSIAIVSIDNAGKKIKLLSHKDFPYSDKETINRKCGFLFSLPVQPVALPETVEHEAEIYVSMSADFKECGIKLIVPIQTETSEIAGAVMLGNKLSERKYTLPDIELLKTLTTNVAFIMRRMELQEQLIARELEKHKSDEERKKVIREMKIAKEVQQKLFPHAAPSINSIDYFGICYPADDVGGDYYDYFLLGTDKIAFAIGDVSGHGLSSALMMAGVTASIRSKAPLFKDNLTGLIEDLNEYLCKTTMEGKFFTLFYAVYDIQKKSLNYVNAGHVPPILCCKSENKFIDLIEGGLMLGMIEDIKFEEKEIFLNQNDVIVMITDGITETMNKEKEMWGMERMKNVIKTNTDMNPKELSELIVNEAGNFSGGLPPDDDITIISVKVK